MLVRAKKSFLYGGYEVVKGEFFDLRGLRNDERLLGLGYCEEAHKKDQAKALSCDCGKAFASEVELRSHQEQAHKR